MWFDTDQLTPAEAIADVDVESLLLDLSERTFTGMLHYEGESRSAQILFEEGFVLEVFTYPTREEDKLGSMLRLGEQVSRDDLQRARRRAERDDRTLQSVLCELDILEADQLRHAVTGRLDYLLNQVCDSSEGEATLYEPTSELLRRLPPSELRTHVAIEQIIFQRRLERFSQLDPDKWEQMIEVYGEMSPREVEGASGRIQRSFTDPAHRQLGHEFIDGRHSFEHIITENPLPPGETIAVVSALRSMGLVEFRTTVSPGIIARRFGDLVETKHLSVHKASYFEVLNIHWSSYDEVADAAYERMASRYDTNHLPEGLSPEVRDKAEAIAERIEKAYDVLKYRKTRHKYRQKIMPDYKLEHAVPLLLKKAELARQRQQLDLARDACRRVLEVNPEHRGAKRRIDELG